MSAWSQELSSPCCPQDGKVMKHLKSGEKGDKLWDARHECKTIKAIAKSIVLKSLDQRSLKRKAL